MPTQQQLDQPQRSADQHRWVARPWLARAVQLLVILAPITVSVQTAAVLAAVLPHANDLGAAFVWWAVVVGGSTAVLLFVDRVARRLLPLALLLRLSLLFPEEAPKRFRVAAGAWSTRRAREHVEAVLDSNRTESPRDAAAQILGLLASLTVHDRRTRGHCERVRAYNDMLAEEMGLPPADRDRLRWAALIHDIGKLKVSPRLLNKPGQPTAREWTVLRAHPERGAEIAAPLADWLGPWADAIAHHHERWDGHGYPKGLTGEEISLGGRVVAVADAFEVMTSARPYSRAVSAAAARTELAKCAGSHFDPVVVRAFLNISLGRLRRTMGPLALVAQIPVLAGMPRLEAALVAGGRSAAAGAGAAAGAAGAVAVTTLSPVADHPHTHVLGVHQHRDEPVGQSSAAISLPLPRVAASPQPIRATANKKTGTTTSRDTSTKTADQPGNAHRSDSGDAHTNATNVSRAPTHHRHATTRANTKTTRSVDSGAVDGTFVSDFVRCIHLAPTVPSQDHSTTRGTSEASEPKAQARIDPCD